MADLGLRGTELGAVGFLPEEPASISTQLSRHGLELVGGFVPLVLHEPDLSSAIEEAHRSARLIAEAGGRMFVVGVVQDLAWSTPRELDDAGWARLAHHLNEI